MSLAVTARVLHHGDMWWVVLLVVVVAVVVAAVVARRDRPAPSAAPEEAAPRTYRRPAVEGPFLGPIATIRLDVEVTDPEAPSVQRLVATTTARVLRTSPDVEEVIVEDRTGRDVARVPRRTQTPGPPPTRPEAEAPASRPRSSWREPAFVPGVDQDTAVARRPLAERLELPDDVRERVTHADDAVDVVRAMLESVGRDVVVQGTMIRSGRDVVIVVGDAGANSRAALSKAFLRVRESGASRGVVIHLGYVDPREIARRRSLAPEVHHAGAEVLQQMADAVALGGDPVEFAFAEAD
jgi:hypothetical protein